MKTHMSSVRSSPKPLYISVSVVVIFFLLFSAYRTSDSQWTISKGTISNQASVSPVPPSSGTTAAADGNSSWTFDFANDARRYGLTRAQCDSAFSKLWEQELSSRLESVDSQVTVKDVEIGWSRQGTVRAMIYNHQLYVLETKGCTRFDFRERSNAILHSINRALTASPDPIPNIEFSFNIEDVPNDEEVPVGTTWSLTKRKYNTTTGTTQWLMPDFGYWSWANPIVGSYEMVLDKIQETDALFEKKVSRVVWRGSAGLHKQRQALLNLTKDQNWADVREVDWAEPSTMLGLHEHCGYKYVIHTEGRSYSGRLKYILSCGSLVIIPAPLAWDEYFHPLLVAAGPNQNFVAVKSDFSDLEEKISYYEKNPEEAKLVAENSRTVFREKYLTPAAQSCYWRRLFDVWKTKSFEPELYAKSKKGEARKYRGIPFGTFILNDAVDITLET